MGGENKNPLIMRERQKNSATTQVSLFSYFYKVIFLNITKGQHIYQKYQNFHTYKAEGR